MMRSSQGLQAISPGRKILKYIRYTSYAGRASLNDLYDVYLGQIWPRKPATLNLLVNDICNSRCQMCLIWKRKRDKEITPDELDSILNDPLFSRLRYVGVSGGEPTLRKDLPELFKVLVNKKPRIHATGVITNAILPDEVLKNVLTVAEICNQAGVRFNVMVSLDGLGEVHDHIRGRQGNFTSSMEVIDHLRESTTIPVSFGFTITKDNVWHVDDFLDFAQAKGLYGRFRVAEFINRLYNEEATSVIRNFTSAEAYHLGLFFTRLERRYEINRKYRRTYRNLRSMIMEGTPRAIKCPYQTQAVVLDSRGQMLYCSPKSPILDNALENSAENIYRNNIETRKQIIARDCSSCVHDYHAEPTIKELKNQVGRYLWQRRLQNPSRFRFPLVINKTRQNHPLPLNKTHHALIVGWYGTETAGDKAILGELLFQLKGKDVQRITLASFNPFLSSWTVKELGFPEVEIIDTYSPDFLRVASIADETIMGGGPLMDLAALGPVLSAFKLAKKKGRRTRIAGCGIGPLRKPRYIDMVKQILQLSDRIEMRDTKSLIWVQQNLGSTNAVLSCDPAIEFVHRWKSLPTKSARSQTLNCYFREWTREYADQLSQTEFEIQKEQFENGLGTFVRAFASRYSLKPRLIAMHHFVLGGDDREFNRKFAKEHLSEFDPVVEIQPYSVFDILESMQTGSFSITMRYHSTLFAQTLAVPYYAIDYSRGGKVKNFLADNNALDRLIQFDQIAQARWDSFVNAAPLHERPSD